MTITAQFGKGCIGNSYEKVFYLVHVDVIRT